MRVARRTDRDEKPSDDPGCRHGVPWHRLCHACDLASIEQRIRFAREDLARLERDRERAKAKLDQALFVGAVA